MATTVLAVEAPSSSGVLWGDPHCVTPVYTFPRVQHISTRVTAKHATISTFTMEANDMLTSLETARATAAAFKNDDARTQRRPSRSRRDSSFNSHRSGGASLCTTSPGIGCNDRDTVAPASGTLGVHHQEGSDATGKMLLAVAEDVSKAIKAAGSPKRWDFYVAKLSAQDGKSLSASALKSAANLAANSNSSKSNSNTNKNNGSSSCNSNNSHKKASGNHHDIRAMTAAATTPTIMMTTPTTTITTTTTMSSNGANNASITSLAGSGGVKEKDKVNAGTTGVSKGFNGGSKNHTTTAPSKPSPALNLAASGDLSMTTAPGEKGRGESVIPRGGVYERAKTADGGAGRGRVGALKRSLRLEHVRSQASMPDLPALESRLEILRSNSMEKEKFLEHVQTVSLHQRQRRHLRRRPADGSSFIQGMSLADYGSSAGTHSSPGGPRLAYGATGTMGFMMGMAGTTLCSSNSSCTTAGGGSGGGISRGTAVMRGRGGGSNEGLGTGKPGKRCIVGLSSPTRQGVVQGGADSATRSAFSVADAHNFSVGWLNSPFDRTECSQLSDIATPANGSNGQQQSQSPPPGSQPPHPLYRKLQRVNTLQLIRHEEEVQWRRQHLEEQWRRELESKLAAHARRVQHKKRLQALQRVQERWLVMLYTVLCAVRFEQKKEAQMAELQRQQASRVISRRLRMYVARLVDIKMQQAFGTLGSLLAIKGKQWIRRRKDKAANIVRHVLEIVQKEDEMMGGAMRLVRAIVKVAKIRRKCLIIQRWWRRIMLSVVGEREILLRQWDKFNYEMQQRLQPKKASSAAAVSAWKNTGMTVVSRQRGLKALGLLNTLTHGGQLQQREGQQQDTLTSSSSAGGAIAQPQQHVPSPPSLSPLPALSSSSTALSPRQQPPHPTGTTITTTDANSFSGSSDDIATQLQLQQQQRQGSLSQAHPQQQQQDTDDVSNDNTFFSDVGGHFDFVTMQTCLQTIRLLKTSSKTAAAVTAGAQAAKKANAPLLHLAWEQKRKQQRQRQLEEAQAAQEAQRELAAVKEGDTEDCSVDGKGGSSSSGGGGGGGAGKSQDGHSPSHAAAAAKFGKTRGLMRAASLLRLTASEPLSSTDTTTGTAAESSNSKHIKKLVSTKPFEYADSRLASAVAASAEERSDEEGEYEVDDEQGVTVFGLKGDHHHMTRGRGGGRGGEGGGGNGDEDDEDNRSSEAFSDSDWSDTGVPERKLLSPLGGGSQTGLLNPGGGGGGDDKGGDGGGGGSGVEEGRRDSGGDGQKRTVGGIKRRNAGGGGGGGGRRSSNDDSIFSIGAMSTGGLPNDAPTVIGSNNMSGGFGGGGGVGGGGSGGGVGGGGSGGKLFLQTQKAKKANALHHHGSISNGGGDNGPQYSSLWKGEGSVRVWDKTRNLPRDVREGLVIGWLRASKMEYMEKLRQYYRLLWSTLKTNHHALDMCLYVAAKGKGKRSVIVEEELRKRGILVDGQVRPDRPIWCARQTPEELAKLLETGVSYTLMLERLWDPFQPTKDADGAAACTDIPSPEDFSSFTRGQYGWERDNLPRLQLQLQAVSQQR